MTPSTHGKSTSTPHTERAHLAQRVQRLHSSPLRDIFSAISNDRVISFAGGLPAAETFPDLSSVTLESQYLQYGASEGEFALREHIAAQLCKNGLKTTAERVLILSGSQQGIDLVAKLLVEPDTLVGIESPTYLAALQVFGLFGARYSTFEPGHVATAFQKEAPALIYSVPTFQNPSGYTYTTQQRKMLANLCDTNGSILFEDDPYRELSYEHCDRTPVCAQIQSSDWIYQSSFSKTIAPGLRIGYLTCSDSLFPYLLQLKQAADLHSCRLSQQVLMHLLRQQAPDDNSQCIANTYKNKRDFFNQSLHEHFHDLADWQLPKGGFFYWLTLKPHVCINTTLLLKQALKEGVAFMPGEHFFVKERAEHNSLRLNFSNASSHEVEHGLQVLANLIRQSE